MPTIAGAGDLEEGDVILTNHPYFSGGLVNHTPDLTFIKPYFHGGSIVCYGYDFIHSTDVGGKVPSSISPTSSEIFQEGLLIPPLKIKKRGRLNDDLLALYRANVRTPDLNLQDMSAMFAAIETGERRSRRSSRATASRRSSRPRRTSRSTRPRSPARCSGAFPTGSTTSGTSWTTMP